MLNRRFLRAKVMQILYALEQTKKAEYQLSIDLIEERFTPEWHEERKSPEEWNLIKKHQKQASEIFSENYEADKILIEQVETAKVKTVATEAVLHYQNQLKKEVRHFNNYLKKEVQNIYELYLLLLQMPVEIAKLVKRDFEKAKENPYRKVVVKEEYKFAENILAKHIKNHDFLQKEIDGHKVSWTTYEEFLKDFYRKVLKKDDQYLAYQKLETNSWEEDKKILVYLLKNLALKHENAEAFFEGINIAWLENRKIIQSLIHKTFKDLEDETAADFALSPLSKNWEDDQIFFDDLYAFYTQAPVQEIENIIAKNAKNWNLDRLALIDKVILKMAIVEMMHFYSIPIKVSINEYIELAKTYSTPKSKRFINGLLDRISQELVNSGKAKKSGRGLMDNK